MYDWMLNFTTATRRSLLYETGVRKSTWSIKSLGIRFIAACYTDINSEKCSPCGKRFIDSSKFCCKHYGVATIKCILYGEWIPEFKFIHNVAIPTNRAPPGMIFFANLYVNTCTLDTIRIHTAYTVRWFWELQLKASKMFERRIIEQVLSYKNVVRDFTSIFLFSISINWNLNGCSFRWKSSWYSDRLLIYAATLFIF